MLNCLIVSGKKELAWRLTTLWRNFLLYEKLKTEIFSSQVCVCAAPTDLVCAEMG